MAELDYDYNKDGKVDAADVAIASGQRTTSTNFAQGAATGLAAGAAGGAAIGAGIGAVFGGFGAVPGAGIGAVVGGIGGSITGAIAGGTAEANNNAQLENILKNKYNFTDVEIQEYVTAIDELKKIDEASGGKISQINKSVEKITTRAKQIQDVNFGSGLGSSFDMIASGSSSEKQNLINTANKEITAEANKLGIDLTSITVDENYFTNVSNELGKYKTKYGYYSVPNIRVDEKNITTAQKSIFEKAYNLDVNKIYSVDSMQTNASNQTTTMAAAAPSTIDNGDGTITNTTPNADGTSTATTTDAEGNVLKTETLSTTQTQQTFNYGMSAGGVSPIKPTDFIGLTGEAKTTGETYITDANGNRVQSEAIYTYADADNYFNGLTEQQIKDTKKKLYASGYYGASDIVSVLQGTISEADKKAIAGAMGDSNLNGLNVDDYMQPKYETYLLTGRPVGEKAVDLNGDGTADASVTTALQSFFDRNGLAVSENYIKTYEESIKNGSTTLDDVMKQVREKMITSAYPAWKDEIMSGKDIADIASPYVQAMKSTLGLIDVDMNDPLLQGALSKSGPDGKPTYTSLFDFKQQMRKDARWENTDEAQKEYADTALTVLKTFGIIG